MAAQWTLQHGPRAAVAPWQRSAERPGGLHARNGGRAAAEVRLDRDLSRPASSRGSTARPTPRWRPRSAAQPDAAAAASAQQQQQQGGAEEEARPAWSSAVAVGLEAGVEEAVAEAVRQALAAPGWPAGAEPSLAFVFVTSSFQRFYDRVLPLLRERLPSLENMVGCSGYGVLGMRQGEPEEWEGQPALALTLAHLPGVSLSTFHVPPGGLPDADAPPAAWHSLVGATPAETGHTSFVLLSDAAFGGVTDLTAGLDYAFPEAVKVGGLNSSISPNALRALWQWSKCADAEGTSITGIRSGGCAGLVLQGPLRVDTLVAQGCRPLGEGTYSVTRAHKSLVVEVQREGEGGGKAGKPEAPLSIVQQELLRLGAEERDTAARNLMVGLAADDFKPQAELGPGDFLVRQVMGADPGSGALMVGDVVRVGQRLRFMVRDRDGAMQDLVSHGTELKRRELAASLAGSPLPPPLGALLFTCNGRGRGLYRVPHFDSRTLAEYVPAPSAGFFCNGEIGMVGPSTHLHGFTCSAAIFRPAPAEPEGAAEGAAAGEQQLPFPYSSGGAENEGGPCSI